MCVWVLWSHAAVPSADGAVLLCCQAFDVLEKLDPNPKYWEGKRSACIGQFQLVVAGKESRLVVHLLG